MNGLVEIRKRGKRLMIGLFVLSNMVTISILILYQLVAVPLLRTSLTSPANNNFTAFIIVFGIAVILDGAIAAWGIRWFWKRARCPACAGFLNQFLVPDEGICRHCGAKWSLKNELRG